MAAAQSTISNFLKKLITLRVYYAAQLCDGLSYKVILQMLLPTTGIYSTSANTISETVRNHEHS